MKGAVPTPLAQAIGYIPRPSFGSRHGTLGLCQQTLLVVLVVTPEPDGKHERNCERRPADWPGDKVDRPAEQVTAETEYGCPDNPSRRVVDDELERRQTVCARQQCGKRAEKRNETAEEDYFSAVSREEIPPQRSLS